MKKLEIEKPSASSKKPSKLLLALIVVTVLAIASVTAVTIITAPEHVTGVPQDPEPTPTPSPTQVPVALHLTSNNTDPFYKGDYLTMTATLTPAQSGITITLYNNGNLVTTAQTNTNGVAVITRQPFNPFDYTVTAELP